MGERRASAIERILQRIEEHVEDWRRRDAALQAEADESRSQLWAEAAERERLLADFGLDHFEGRSYLGWHRHVTLTALAQAFCTQLRRDPKAPAPA